MKPTKNKAEKICFINSILITIIAILYMFREGIITIAAMASKYALNEISEDIIIKTVKDLTIILSKETIALVIGCIILHILNYIFTKKKNDKLLKILTILSIIIIVFLVIKIISMF